MPPLVWDRRPDGLRAPALVCAFKGWNDAGDAASAAVQFLGASHSATRFAQIDPEDFYDFQATRPRIKLDEHGSRELSWPNVEIYEARVPLAPRDLVLLTGPEPSMRWRTFCASIVELAEVLGVQMVVTVGALLADVPHSRPVSITGLTSDETLTGDLGLNRSGYEGPTGITGVLWQACAEAGLPSASLWAAVPHYVAAAPNPKAALALIRGFEAVGGIAVNATDLEESAEEYQRQVDAAVATDPEVKSFVERLEQTLDEVADELAPDPGQLPSADAIARDFQRFLRQKGAED
jgi:predicted ATP-grasp superfamily ATP-dependent carboligase